MAKCFFEEMIAELKTRKTQVDGRTLKRYIGGQVHIYYPEAGWLLGYVEDISIGLGTLEVSTPWVAFRKYRGRIWRIDPKRSEIGFLTIQPNGGHFEHNGVLCITGFQADMFLVPKGSTRVISKKEIRNK